MRSGQATVILGGFPRVANLHGGMLLWQQMGLPVPRSTGPLPK
jgi:sulfur dioxygenase